MIVAVRPEDPAFRRAARFGIWIDANGFSHQVARRQVLRSVTGVDACVLEVIHPKQYGLLAPLYYLAPWERSWMHILPAAMLLPCHTGRGVLAVLAISSFVTAMRFMLAAYDFQKFQTHGVSAVHRVLADGRMSARAVECYGVIFFILGLLGGVILCGRDVRAYGIACLAILFAAVARHVRFFAALLLYGPLLGYGLQCVVGGVHHWQFSLSYGCIVAALFQIQGLEGSAFHWRRHLVTALSLIASIFCPAAFFSYLPLKLMYQASSPYSPCLDQAWRMMRYVVAVVGVCLLIASFSRALWYT